MYIEQGYKGDIGLWKYFIIPVGFIGFMALNYILTINSDIDVEVAMGNMIEQFGSNLVLIILLAPLVFGFFLILVFLFWF